MDMNFCSTAIPLQLSVLVQGATPQHDVLLRGYFEGGGGALSHLGSAGEATTS